MEVCVFAGRQQFGECHRVDLVPDRFARMRETKWCAAAKRARQANSLAE